MATGLDINSIIKSLATDRDLVMHFFTYFSRFEYCLKRSSFLKKGKDGRKAEPDWHAYASCEKVKGQFKKIQNQEFQEAVKLLMLEPPGQQIVNKENHLKFVKIVRKQEWHDEKYILELVKTIRNNLFHGGKYPHPVGPVSDVARNDSLLRACTIVLKQCIELSDFSSIFAETA